jgi:hypothetical protein
MKRIVLAVTVVASVGLIAACSGGGGGGIGPNCTKYLKCCDSIGGATASGCDSSFGSSSSCGTTTATAAACETSCQSGYAGIQTAALAADAGNSSACP